MKDTPCARCGGVTPTLNNERWTTFWGAIEHNTTTTTEHDVRILASVFRQESDPGRLTRTDERIPLCSNCWGLVMSLIRGQAIPELPKTVPK